MSLAVSPHAPASPSAAKRAAKDDELLARYAVLRRLRKTMYGETLLCRDRQRAPSAPLVVLKRIGLAALRENAVGGHENPLQERHMIELLHRVGGHAHIVSYERGDAPAMFVARQSIYVAMEFCDGGDLFDLVQAQPDGRLRERHALRLVRDIAAGVAFLHRHDVAHRDLSLENVLLRGDRALLCDFGLSCDARRRRTDAVGKPYYMAPEMFLPDGASYDARRADIWSLGVVLFVLLTGSPLVADEQWRHKTLRVVARFGVGKVLELWQMTAVCSEPTLALLSAMLQVDPSRRPSADEILAHAAFRDEQP
ncbi:hypothetical protein P43SY_001502 [Pythium insidiosum]|uniref:Protein kinase domain-containing protein n=1 Tax=Pythium insidiosum TaxID=114742 RepID=A0AAD5Q467_PYTIN|nr:hypothetical protein P43SY_001502 [Pythium insidiosum]